MSDPICQCGHSIGYHLRTTHDCKVQGCNCLTFSSPSNLERIDARSREIQAEMERRIREDERTRIVVALRTDAEKHARDAGVLVRMGLEGNRLALSGTMHLIASAIADGSL